MAEEQNNPFKTTHPHYLRTYYFFLIHLGLLRLCDLSVLFCLFAVEVTFFNLPNLRELLQKLVV